MGVNVADGRLQWAAGIDTGMLAKDAMTGVNVIQGMSNKIAAIAPFAGLAAGAALAFGAIAASAIQFEREFETAMAEIQTISQYTTDNLQKVKDQLYEMASDSSKSVVDLANSLYEIVSSGYDGANAMEVLNASVMAAKAGFIDVKTAGDGITTVLNAWGLAAEDATRVTDIFFQSVNLGKVTFDQLANEISVVAPFAAALGVPFEQVAAAVATLTKQGIPAAVAMTQIRAGLTSVAENLGATIFKTHTLQESFELLAKSADYDFNKLVKLTGRIESVNGVLSMTGEKAAMAANDLASFGDSLNGITERAAQKVDQTLTEQIGIMKNRWKELMSGIGESGTGFLYRNVKAASEMIDDLNSKDLTGWEKFWNVFFSWYVKFEPAGKKIEDVADDMIAKFREASGEIINNDTLENEIEIARKKLVDYQATVVQLYKDQAHAVEEQRKIEIQAEIDKINKFQGAWSEYFEKLRKMRDDFTIVKPEPIKAPEGSEGYVFPLEKFKDELDKAKQIYEDYNAVVAIKGKSAGQEFLKSQLGTLEVIKTTGANYKKTVEGFLISLIPKYKENMEAIVEIGRSGGQQLLDALKAADYRNMFFDENKKTSPTKLEDGILDPKGLNVLKGLNVGLEAQDKILRKIGLTEKQIAEIRAKSASAKLEPDPDELQKQLDLRMQIVDAVGMLANALAQAVGLDQQSTAMLNGFMGVVQGLASQNYIQAGASLISTIFSAFSNEERTVDKLALSMEKFNRQMEIYQHQLEIAGQQGGAADIYRKEIESTRQTIEELKAQRAELLKVQQVFAQQGKPEHHGLTAEIKKVDEAIVDTTADLEDAQIALDSFLSGGLTQTTIADSIAEGFKNGKHSAEDFAKYMNDLLYDAVLKAFSTQILGTQINELTKFIADSMADGKLDTAEMQKIKDWYAMIAAQSEDLYNNLTQALENPYAETDKTPTSQMSSAIRQSITEETASVLTGQINAMQINVIEQLRVFRESVDWQRQIAGNTAKANELLTSLVNTASAAETLRGSGL